MTTVYVVTRLRFNQFRRKPATARLKNRAGCRLLGRIQHFVCWFAPPFGDACEMVVSCVQLSHDTVREVALMEEVRTGRISFSVMSKALQWGKLRIRRGAICHSRASYLVATSRISLVAGLIMTGATLVNLPAFQTTNPTTLGLRQYAEAIAAGVEPFELSVANNWVHTGIIHHEPRLISPGENWLQAILGGIYAPIKNTQDTNRLLAGGIANCSERAQILKTIAESADCQCRFVGLEGHVVLEVNSGGRWQVADPDYGVVFASDMNVLVMPEQKPLITAALSAAGYTQHAIDQYLCILQSTEDNQVLPIGSAISPRLYQLEQSCKYLIWVIPAIAVLYGGLPLGSRMSAWWGGNSEKQPPMKIRNLSADFLADQSMWGKQSKSINRHKSSDSREQACIYQ